MPPPLMQPQATTPQQGAWQGLLKPMLTQAKK